jgi:hypothetical protein
MKLTSIIAIVAFAFAAHAAEGTEAAATPAPAPALKMEHKGHMKAEKKAEMAAAVSGDATAAPVKKVKKAKKH